MRECLSAHEMYDAAISLITQFALSNVADLIPIMSSAHLFLFSQCRSMSHCWPDGKTRTQRAWSNSTTRRPFGTMTRNPTCSISTAESLRPRSRISKSSTTTTVSASSYFSVNTVLMTQGQGLYCRPTLTCRAEILMNLLCFNWQLKKNWNNLNHYSLKLLCFSCWCANCSTIVAFTFRLG